jgi:hypothetical protein
MDPSPTRVPGDPGHAGDTPPAELVRFFERGGPDGRAALMRLRGALVADGASVELLVGDDRPDLHLLVVRGGGADPDVDAATRVWRFRRCAP